MGETKFNRSKVVVEVEVIHQFDPIDAIAIIENHLQFPAIESFKVLKVETKDSSDNFVEVDFKNCIERRMRIIRGEYEYK